MEQELNDIVRIVRIIAETVESAYAAEYAALDAAEQRAAEIGRAFENDPAETMREEFDAAGAEVLRRFGRWEGAQAVRMAVRNALAKI